MFCMLHIDQLIGGGPYAALYARGLGLEVGPSTEVLTEIIVGYNVCFPILVLILSFHVEYVILHCDLHDLYIRQSSVFNPVYRIVHPRW
jgi:hypothetical protein